MKRLLQVLLFLLIALFVWPLWPTAAAPASSNDRVPGQVLVKFKPGVSQNTIFNLLGQNNASVKNRINEIGVLVLNVPQNQEQKVSVALSRNANVLYAEPDFIATAFGSTNDPMLSSQWGMFKIEAAASFGPSAWDITTGTSSVKIAILDTGIDQDHEDISSKINGQANFTDSSTADDIYGHGTHVGGTVAAATNNSIGVTGVGYDSSLMNVKVLNDSGSGAYSWVANGIVWATTNGAKVINMSLGGSLKSRALEDAVNYAWNNNVVIAAAAGNSGNTSPTYPAKYANVIAVAATDSNDQKASFSSYGSWVDVAAPGVNILSTFPNHPFVIQEKYGRSQNYDYANGTSMATPHVAGLAGLIWSTNICSTNSCVRSQIENNADAIAGTGTYWTHGRINAYKAVRGTIPSPSPSPSPSPEPSPTPTPTPSPSPVPSTIMHVGDMTMRFEKKGANFFIYTTVPILDQNTSPVAGATVYLTMTLPDGLTASGSGTTGAGGTVTFRFNSKQTGTYTSTVTDVVLDGATYNSSLNFEPSESILVN